MWMLKIVFILLAIYFIWSFWNLRKGNPEIFSKENMGKSLTTTGVLTLLLIGFVGFLVLLLRQ